MLRNRRVLPSQQSHDPQQEERQPVQEYDEDTIVVSGCRGQHVDDESDTIVVSGHRRQRSEDLGDEIIVSGSRSQKAGAELAPSQASDDEEMEEKTGGKDEMGGETAPNDHMGEQTAGQNVQDRGARRNEGLEPQTALNGVMGQENADFEATQEQSVSGTVGDGATAGQLAGQLNELDDEMAGAETNVDGHGQHPNEEYAVGADEASIGDAGQRTDQDDALEGGEISFDHLREQASANDVAEIDAAAGEVSEQQTMQDPQIGSEESALDDGSLGPDGVQRQDDENGHFGPRPTSEASTSSISVARDEAMSEIPAHENVREGSSTSASVRTGVPHSDSQPEQMPTAGSSIQQHVPESGNALRPRVTNAATTQEHLHDDTQAEEGLPRGDHMEERPPHSAAPDDRLRTRDASEIRLQRQRTDPGFIFSQKLYRLMHELAEEEWIDLLAHVKEDAYGGRMLSLELVPRTGLRPEPVAPIYPSAATTKGRKCGICLDDFDLVPDPVYLCRRCRFPVHIFCQARANFSDRVASRLPKCSNWYASAFSMCPSMSILTYFLACSFGSTGLMSTVRKGLTRR